MMQSNVGADRQIAPNILICLASPFSGSTFVRYLFGWHHAISLCQGMTVPSTWDAPHPLTTLHPECTWEYAFNHIQNPAGRWLMTYRKPEWKIIVPVRHPFLILRSHYYRSGHLHVDAAMRIMEMLDVFARHPDAFRFKVDELEWEGVEARHERIREILKDLGLEMDKKIRTYAEKWKRCGPATKINSRPVKKLSAEQRAEIWSCIRRLDFLRRYEDAGLLYGTDDPWLSDGGG